MRWQGVNRRNCRCVTLVLAVALGISTTALAVPAGATTKTPKPIVTSFTASPLLVSRSGGVVTLVANVVNSSSCTLSSNRTVPDLPLTISCIGGLVSDPVTLPANTGKRPLKYKFTLAATGTDTTRAMASASVSSAPTPISSIRSITADDEGGYCGVLTSGGVDCWGRGALGNGSYGISAVPVPVVGLGGVGTLAGVASLASDYGGYCAILTAGGVDCWGWSGYTSAGALGDGSTNSSAIPVAVVGLGGVGTLAGVVSLTSDYGGYCAVLIGGGVDCWGYGYDGELGDGAFHTSGNDGSDVPVAVQGEGGMGILTGVSSLASHSLGGQADQFCALLTTGGVDCWGYGPDGQLGNGAFGNSAFPVAVEGEGGLGALTGVVNLTGSFEVYCAILASQAVDCWGVGSNGQLGNGTSSNTAVPVTVEGEGGVGALEGVTSIASDGMSDCAVLISGGVDCWGYGTLGNLGNGYFVESAIPVPVLSAGGSGRLSGVASLTGHNGYCALLVSSAIDCWGDGTSGALGNGTFALSATPVFVDAIGSQGFLEGVTSIVSDYLGGCALLASGGVDCWGGGESGQLGNGIIYSRGKQGSATPVSVVSPV
jgi:hypothetical protein